MSRLGTSFVLGYHGCDRSIAVRAINGEIDLLHSNNDYDWLGPGIYFWESDPQRALEWAEDAKKRGKLTHPAVVGAVIDLRNCLDLVARENLDILTDAHHSFLKAQRDAGLEPPKNHRLKGRADPDQMMRYLDCAVIRHLHSILDSQPSEGRVIEPFDTVRGMFPEGTPIYPTSGFRQKNHVQIAARDKACVLGLFFPRTELFA